MNIFRKLLGMHQHKWMLVEHGQLIDRKGYKTGLYWTYMCPVCHKVKEVRS